MDPVQRDRRSVEIPAYAALERFPLWCWCVPPRERADGKTDPIAGNMSSGETLLRRGSHSSHEVYVSILLVCCDTRIAF